MLDCQQSYTRMIIAIVLLGLWGSQTSQVAYAAIGDQRHKLFAVDGRSFDGFGFSVAISGNVAVVGAPEHDTGGLAGLGAGSAYLYDVDSGNQIAKLTPSDETDRTGQSVAISGDLVLVGSPFTDAGDNGAISFPIANGAAYLFNTNPGQELRRFLADDFESLDSFGFGVALEGTTALISAPNDDDNGSESGSAYVFDVTTGEQSRKLLAEDGAAGDKFGFAVAVSGNTAIISSPDDDDRGNSSGSAYIFDLDTGQQRFKLVPDDSTAGDIFGFDVAVSGNVAVVSSPNESDNGTGSGAVYLFNTETGAQLAKILAEAGAALDDFGSSVDIDGNILVVGAKDDDDNGTNSGSAFVFDIDTGELIAKLLASDGGSLEEFGSSVGVDGGTIVVGAQNLTSFGVGPGAAYVFDVPEPASVAIFGILASTLFSRRYMNSSIA